MPVYLWSVQRQKGMGLSRTALIAPRPWGGCSAALCQFSSKLLQYIQFWSQVRIDITCSFRCCCREHSGRQITILVRYQHKVKASVVHCLRSTGVCLSIPLHSLLSTKIVQDDTGVCRCRTWESKIQHIYYNFLFAPEFSPLRLLYDAKKLGVIEKFSKIYRFATKMQSSSSESVEEVAQLKSFSAAVVEVFCSSQINKGNTDKHGISRQLVVLLPRFKNRPFYRLPNHSPLKPLEASFKLQQSLAMPLASPGWWKWYSYLCVTFMSSICKTLKMPKVHRASHVPYYRARTKIS